MLGHENFCYLLLPDVLAQWWQVWPLSVRYLESWMG